MDLLMKCSVLFTILFFSIGFSAFLLKIADDFMFLKPVKKYLRDNIILMGTVKYKEYEEYEKKMEKFNKLLTIFIYCGLLLALYFASNITTADMFFSCFFFSIFMLQYPYESAQ